VGNQHPHTKRNHALAQLVTASLGANRPPEAKAENEKGRKASKQSVNLTAVFAKVFVVTLIFVVKAAHLVQQEGREGLVI